MYTFFDLKSISFYTLENFVLCHVFYINFQLTAKSQGNPFNHFLSPINVTFILLIILNPVFLVTQEQIVT